MARNKMSFHPGKLIKEELEARNMSASQLARDLSIPVGRVTEIIRGRRTITPDTAIRLAAYWGGSPRFWLDLQMAHDLSVAESEKGERIRSQIRLAS
jgi:addiction module HigA family antidote